MNNKETKIYKALTNIIRISIIITLIIKILMADYSHIHTLIGVFIFTFYNKFLLKINLRFSCFVNCFFVIFLFLTQCLGEACNFYNIFSWWDIFLHTMAGVLFYEVGKELIIKLNTKGTNLIVIVLFAFCFSLAIGLLWEIIEFSDDTFFGKNTQKARGLCGRNALFDTMSDLIVLTIGAFLTGCSNYILTKRKTPNTK